MGISHSATIDEALKIADDKAVKRFLNLRKVDRFLQPHAVSLFIYTLKAGVALPAGLHMSRDTTQESETATGHHSLNSTYGDTNGLMHVERLKRVTFGESWSVKLDYTFRAVGSNGACIVEREHTIATDSSAIQIKVQRWARAIVAVDE